MYQQPSGNPQQQQPQYAYPPLGPNATYQPHSVYQQPIPVPGAQPVATGAVVPVNAPPQSGPFPPQPILASPAPAAAAMPGPAPVQQQVLVRPAAYPQVPTPEMSPIFVAIPETNVITDQGKPFATYTVQFRMGYGLRPLASPHACGPLTPYLQARPQRGVLVHEALLRAAHHPRHARLALQPPAARFPAQGTATLLRRPRSIFAGSLTSLPLSALVR